jgi:hypothetical protein
MAGISIGVAQDGNLASSIHILRAMTSLAHLIE